MSNDYQVRVWDHEWNLVGEVEQGWRSDDPERIVFPLLASSSNPIPDFILRQADADSWAWMTFQGMVFDKATGKQIAGDPPKRKPVVLTVESGDSITFSCLRQWGTTISRPWGHRLFHAEFEWAKPPEGFRPTVQHPAMAFTSR